jgi:hypothetical protein
MFSPLPSANSMYLRTGAKNGYKIGMMDLFFSGKEEK